MINPLTSRSAAPFTEHIFVYMSNNRLHSWPPVLLHHRPPVWPRWGYQMVISRGGGPSSDRDHEDGGLKKGCGYRSASHSSQSYRCLCLKLWRGLKSVTYRTCLSPETVLQESGNISPFIFQTPQRKMWRKRRRQRTKQTNPAKQQRGRGQQRRQRQRRKRASRCLNIIARLMCSMNNSQHFPPLWI